MNNPKVSEKEMLEELKRWRLSLVFNESEPITWGQQEADVYLAIRAAIEERGRLRELIKRLKEILSDVDKKYREPGTLPASVGVLLRWLRDFELDGEEKK